MAKKIICVKCQVEFGLEKMGVKVAEMFQEGKMIYKVWDADKWKCPKCGVEIVSGFGERPLMEHFQGNIQEFLAELKAKGKEIIYDYELKYSPPSSP